MNNVCDKSSPRTGSTKIPTPVSPFKRSSSTRVRGEKANLSSSVPISSAVPEFEDSYDCSARNFNLSKIRTNRLDKLFFDDDLESIGSVASNFSIATNNSTCEHVNFAKNGTTYSGRSHRYIVHCSSSANDQEEYLTPTQRSNRNIKRLKSLLQLAKDKLREKEEEIFKLNKEVLELKSYKTSVETTKNPNADQNAIEITNQRLKDINSVESPSPNFSKFNENERFSEFSPIKHVSEDTHQFKMSPTPSQDGLGDKSSLTSDFLFSSMGDSGNFDDLPSSASIHSKDSISFATPSDLKQMQQDQPAGPGYISNEEDKMKVIRMLEKKLDDKKLDYETKLNQIINNQEENNIKIINEFENKLKEEELKFEARWNELLRVTEEEKIMIVNRFEEKLEEERKKYRESLDQFKARDTKGTELIFEKTYCKEVEEGKAMYENSLMDIKEKFETEKVLIEKKFDDAVAAEREKFEFNLKSMKEISDSRIADLTKQLSEVESEYSELLPKYEKVVSENEKLERENDSLKVSLKEQEESYKKMFLTIYRKGQEAAKLELEDQEAAESEKTSKKVSVSDLFAQLKITEVELENLKAMYKRLSEAQDKSSSKKGRETTGSDPSATLQFLKSAVYYFLTDRENHLGHLKAIESILAFSATEKTNIEKLYLNRY